MSLTLLIIVFVIGNMYSFHYNWNLSIQFSALLIIADKFKHFDIIQLYNWVLSKIRYVVDKIMIIIDS